MATPKLPNHPDNYMIPSAISIWFASLNDDGSLGTWRDLGNVFDISLTFAEEYLDHESARNGLTSFDKTVQTKVTGQVKYTIDELVGCNLLRMFRPKTTPDDTVSYTTLEQKRIKLSGTDAKVIDALALGCDCATDYLELGWDGSVIDVLVRSTDGLTTYVESTDYTFTQAAGTACTGKTPATIARDGGGAIADGAEILVTYEYASAAKSYKVQEGAVMEGAMRVQCLNRIGPLFAYYFPFVSLKTDGDFTINPAEYAKQAFIAEILTDGEGDRGTFYLFDCFQKMIASATC